MPVWTLWQYPNVVTDFCERADVDMWAEMSGRLMALIEQGNMLGLPASEAVGRKTGLFVLRAKSGTKQGRLFYFFAVGRKIIFVHSVHTKKTRTLQQHDIELAMRRKREVEEAEDLSRIIRAFMVDSADYQTH